MPVDSWNLVAKELDFNKMGEQEQMELKREWFEYAFDTAVKEKIPLPELDVLGGSGMRATDLAKQWKYFNEEYAPTEKQRNINLGRATAQELSPTQRVMSGLGGAAVGSAERISQAMGAEPGTFEDPQETQMRQGLEQTTGGMLGRGAFTGLLAGSYMPAALRQPGALRTLGRIGFEGAKTGLAEALPEGSSAESALTAGAVGSVGEAAMGMGGKAIRALRGDVYDQGSEELIKYAKDRGIDRISYADLPKSGPVSRGFVKAGERMPLFGTLRFRVEQNAQAKGAAENFANDFLPTGLNFDMSDDIARNNTFIKSVQDKYKMATRDVAKAYKAVGDLAESKGIMPRLRLNNTIKEMQEIAEEYPQVFDEFNISTSYKRKIEDIIKGTKDFDVREVLELDKIYNSLIGQAKKRQANGGGYEDVLRRLNKAKYAVNSDIDSWAQASNNKDIIALWRDAKQTWREKKLPFESNAAARKIIQDTFDPDRAISHFVMRDRPFRAAKGLQVSTQKGNELLRASAVHDMLSGAYQDGVFMPGKFANNIENKIGSTAQTLFSDVQKRELEGMRNLMRALEDSGFAAHQAKHTKVQSLFLLMGGGSLAGFGWSYLKNHPGDVLGLLASTVGVAKLVGSNGGRRILMAASRAKPRSDGKFLSVQMGNVLMRAEKFLQGEAASALGQAVDNIQFESDYDQKIEPMTGGMAP